MRTKITAGLVILVALMGLSFYIRYHSAETIQEIVGIKTDEIQSITMQLDFTWGTKDFIVDKPKDIGQIMGIIDPIKVVESNKSEITPYGGPFHKKNFQITIFEKDYNSRAVPPKPVNVDISNTKYFNINGSIYKGLNTDEVERLYRITILSQNKSQLDQYYLDLINGE